MDPVPFSNPVTPGCDGDRATTRIGRRQTTSMAQNDRNTGLKVVVRENNVDQALRVLKKKLQREGVFRDIKIRQYYEKPSQRKARERSEAIRRARKLARKRAMLDGRI